MAHLAIRMVATVTLTVDTEGMVTHMADMVTGVTVTPATAWDRPTGTDIGRSL